jgi:predicted RNase H-like nuclease (RuvC/YqgF family)
MTERFTLLERTLIEMQREIERLRADNELLSKHNQEYGTEIGRLRAALEQIKRYTKGNLDQLPYEIARDALEEVGDDG